MRFEHVVNDIEGIKMLKYLYISILFITKPSLEQVNNLLFVLLKNSSSGYRWTKFYVYFIPLIFFSFEMGEQVFLLFKNIF